MIERKELKKLVVIMISTSSNQPTARELYEQIRKENPPILRTERVKSFRGFVKIINSFENVKPTGRRGEAMVYKAKH